MLKVTKALVLLAICSFLISWIPSDQPAPSSYKCLVQLTNYKGEGAYMVVSLLDPDGKYDETLYVMGRDKEWYPDMTEWWAFYNEAPFDIDGISGATISGGERTICAISFDKAKLDAGYKLRFETAVEDQQYFLDDVEIPLTTANVSGKFEGKGYIRYIRIVPN